MINHEEKARELFEEGYNCAQSVFGAFVDMTGLDADYAMKLAAPFGGGIGRLREVCGAVSGMYMVFGVLYGYGSPETGDKKAELYKKVQELAEKFKEIHGSIICREMLDDMAGEGHVPDKRTPEYYAARPCTRACMDAARLLDEFIKENPI